MRRWLVFSLLVAVFAADALAIARRSQFEGELAPLHADAPKKIANQFIVKVKNCGDLQSTIDAVRVSAPDFKLLHTYTMKPFCGFAFASEQAFIAVIRTNADIEYIEIDSYATVTSTQVNPPSWGLDRIDQHNLPLDNLYKFPSHGGDGSVIYVVDTGIEVNHVDFGGRAVHGVTTPAGLGDEDGNGHGTHVAGIAAGSLHGVAKRAKVVAVKVFNNGGFGSISDVIAGVTWFVEDHLNRNSTGGAPSVAVMSIGGSNSPALDDAVESAIAMGVHVVAAIGNSNSDACNFSPVGAPNVIGVGSTDMYDRVASGSNYGPCVTLFAPGVSITSTWIGPSLNATQVLSGSSMAVPHVGGVIALLLPTYPLPPVQMREYLISISTKDVLSNVPANTENRLLYNLPPPQ